MNSFFLIFIGLPALEVFLMIKIGGKIGALNTVSLIFLTAIVGLYFVRSEGVKTIRSGVVNLYQNKIPIYEMASGATIAIAALLLIIPGFFTDTIGFLLLVPFSRKILINSLIKKGEAHRKQEEVNTLDGEIIDDKNKKDDL